MTTAKGTHNNGLRHFSKFTSFSTLFLIFVGGMVTSTGSGLAVPDWPLSYGTLFPPMVGGVFYEHGHRMVASFVGFLMLVLAIWLHMKESRRWVRVIGFIGLAAVILQGILGGITVLFFLPTAVSVSHGVLAQTFFLLTIFLAYTQSREWTTRNESDLKTEGIFLKFLILFIILIYTQLIIGAVMRHTHSGLAVYDFPKMAGKWLPGFDEAMLSNINYWRFDYNLDPVNIMQVMIHVTHRIGALVITIAICILNVLGLKYYSGNKRVLKTLYFLDVLIIIQITLGILTILSVKEPITSSFHVVTGASILGVSFLLLLRSAPISFNQFIKTIT